MTQREAAGADLACAGADGFVDDDAQTGLTGHLVDEHGDMPWRSGGSGARMLVVGCDSRGAGHAATSGES
jgi:hypothetical protein